MLFKISTIMIPFVWFGFVLSISFMEAPLKFTAPNVTLEIGLSIGRVVVFIGQSLPDKAKNIRVAVRAKIHTRPRNITHGPGFRAF